MRYGLRAAAAVLLSLSLAAATQAQSGEFGAWQTKDFGSPEIKADGGALDISGPAAPPSGLYLVEPTDPAKTYRLVVRGAAEAGSATLRLRTGDGEPEYLSAPQGSNEYVVGGAPQIEVLIYSESAFRYRLQSLALEPCPTCQTKAQTLGQASEAVPGWSTDIYHQPTVKRGDGGLLIETDTPPAGVYFRHNLDPAKSYRVTLDGEVTRGSPTLRIVRGKSDPEYAGTTNGQNSLTVAGVDTVELLIYGDAPFAYKLKNLDIHECEKCSKSQ